MKIRSRILSVLMTALAAIPVLAQESISLSGEWKLSIDDSLHYDDYVTLPGSMLTNGKGKAWYRKSVYVPQSWKDKHITLFLERPHIETTVYVNGQEISHQMSLSTPHQYDLGESLVPGQRNNIVICVSVTDQTQGNWNGIIGKMELRCQSRRLYIEKVKAVVDAKTGIVRLHVDFGGTRAQKLPWYVGNLGAMVAFKRLDVDTANVYTDYYAITDKHCVFEFRLGVHKELWGRVFQYTELWDEFFPRVYQVGIYTEEDSYETTIGFRSIETDGRQLIINGRPLYLRGTVESSFPETGYPPTDEATWTNIFQKCRSYGLNHMRFHSYCPPEAAFAAADNAGFYLQVEGASNLYVDTYGHHPSFLQIGDSVGGGYHLQALQPLNYPQTPSYKDEIERNLGSPDYAGFLLPVPIDDIARKTTAAEWSEFCSTIVPLARFPKTVYSNSDTLRVPIEIYNAMYGSLHNARVSYFISTDNDSVLAGGRLSRGDTIKVGRNFLPEPVVLPLNVIKAPAKLTLTVMIGNHTKKNHWDFWVKPD